jgi:hypothetical protein
MIIPRLVFPQTIVIGRKKTHIVLLAGVLEIILNIPLSLLMIKWGYGIVGVALSTFIVNVLSKVYLGFYVWAKMKIKPSEYIPIKTYSIYFAIISIVFTDRHGIIDIRSPKFEIENPNPEYRQSAGSQRFTPR